MSKSTLSLILSGITFLGLAASSSAATLTYFFSQKDGGAVIVPDFLQEATEHGNQAGASIVQTRANFLTAVAGGGLTSGTESFEGDPYSSGINGLPPFFPHELPPALNPLIAPLDFGVGTGTLHTVGNVLNVGDYVPNPSDPQWRFPYDDGAAHAGEQQYVGSVPEGSNATQVVLDQAVNAFGFFASDVGDDGAFMSVRLNFTNGDSELIALEDLGYTQHPSINATSIYFGVLSDMAFDSVDIVYEGEIGTDRYGLDVLTVGIAKSNAVPETGHTLLLGSAMIGFLAFGSAARRRRKA